MISGMRQFTAIVHRGGDDEGGFWATCLEVPGANGQGDTESACLAELADAVRLVVDTARAEAMREDASAREVPLTL